MPPTSETLERALALVQEGLSRNQAADRIGISRSTLKRHLKRYVAEKARLASAERPFEMPTLPSEIDDPDTLWERAEQRNSKFLAARDARKWIDIKVNIPGPIGIAFSADAHLDNPGTDLKMVREHREIVTGTPGMFAVFAGDILDNWPKGGRLAGLHAKASTTEDEGRLLARHHLEKFGEKLLACIWGNHEFFVGSDLVRWLGDRLTSITERDEARLRLSLPNGRQATIIIRHTFAGNSQWNAAHGVMKAAQMGLSADILVCGHIHTSAGAPIISDPMTGKLSHCLQLSSYKLHDPYAVEKGFRPGAPIPCAVAIIDPDAAAPIDFITIVPSPRKGAALLTTLRRERGLQ